MSLGFPKLPRRVKQGLAIAALLLLGVPALQYLMGAPEARIAAEGFLVSNPQIREQLGMDVEVGQCGLFWRSDFGWTPGSTFVTYQLQLVGQKGSMRARIKLRRSDGSKWDVYSATIWTSDGPVAIR